MLDRVPYILTKEQAITVSNAILSAKHWLENERGGTLDKEAVSAIDDIIGELAEAKDIVLNVGSK